MLCTQTEKRLVLFMYFWLWWSSTNTSTIQHVKAQDTVDSLKAGCILNTTSFLESKHEKYWLGFSKTDGSDETYLYIFNSASSEEVWMSDRNKPVNPNSAVLSLNKSGVLKIESGYAKEPIILYSPSRQANNTVATLLDTGNFVLQQHHPNGTVSVLWQSFDYPAYTLLPTMKLGFNRLTHRNWSLVSRLTTSLAVAGVFSLEWEAKARELVIKRRGKACWRSGKLNKSNGMFENIPEQVQRGYNYTVVSTSDEDSFSFTLKTKNNDDGNFMGWMLLQTGILTSSEGDIATADKCYGYNSDGGCQIWEDIPTCRAPGDVFREKIGNPNFQNTNYDNNTSYGSSDCTGLCWSNCNCSGFRKLYNNGTGCIFFLWNLTEDANALDARGMNFYVLEKAAEHGDTGKAKAAPQKGTKKWIWISATIAAILLIICTSILCLALKKQRYRVKEKRRMEANTLDLAALNESSDAKDLEDDWKKEHDIKFFNYTSVLVATNGFSPENKLGQGGFGPVYKGILSTGHEVAVKRLSKTSTQGIIEFKNELTLICELQHTNLVKLLGCCIHEEERILIYEYMPNKSLDFYLFDGTRSKLLDWRKRSNIIEGISQGLLYLHKHSRLKVIHRDLKASNILLDENMNPKISDFGMARMFTQHESVVNTNRIVGTYGYMSPEYAMEGVCSTKSDVYSFGVLLLEIVSGRRNNSFYDANRPLNLIGHAWELWNEGECLKLADPTLNELFTPDEVQRCIHIGLLCVEQHANDRPTMSNVISMLTNKSPIVTSPRRPAFYIGRETDILGGTTASKFSNTTLTNEVLTSSEVE